MLKDAENDNYKSKFRDNARNSKGTWNVVNEIIIRKDKTSSNIEYLNDNVNVKDPDKESNYIDLYSSTIGSNLANVLSTTNMTPTNYLTNTYPDFQLVDTSPKEILTIIRYLKDSAAGPDEICIKVLKLTAKQVSPII